MESKIREPTSILCCLLLISLFFLPSCPLVPHNYCFLFPFTIWSQLPLAHSYHLSLNDSPIYTHHNSFFICNFSHLLFYCFKMFNKCLLSNLYLGNNILFTFPHIFQFSNIFLIQSIINVFLSGFL